MNEIRRSARKAVVALAQLPAAIFVGGESDLDAIEQAKRAGARFTVFQPWTTSSADRYPRLFDRLSELLADHFEPRLLSFGCAGGEEVRALRMRFADAWIVGADVNPRAIVRARNQDGHPRSFYLFGDRPIPGEMFDAVLALAVFRHGAEERGQPESCASILPFDLVAQGFTRLDAVLKPGGWLVWGNAHFRFSDMPGAHRYVSEPCDENPVQSHLVYGPDNRRIAGGIDPGGLYRKLA